MGQTAFANIDLKNVGFSDAHVPIGTITAAAILQNGQSELDERLIMFDIVSINNFPYSYPLDYLYLFNQDGLGSIIQAGSTVRLRIEMRPKELVQTASRLSFL